jgi:hypothetical protein
LRPPSCCHARADLPEQHPGEGARNGPEQGHAFLVKLEVAPCRNSTRLPANSKSTVISGRTDDIPVILLAVGSTGDQQQPATRLTNEVAPELRKINDVRAATVTGAPKPTVTITLDYAKLADAKLADAGIDRPGPRSHCRPRGPRYRLAR